jgi:hypothetical protein
MVFCAENHAWADLASADLPCVEPPKIGLRVRAIHRVLPDPVRKLLDQVRELLLLCGTLPSGVRLWIRRHGHCSACWHAPCIGGRPTTNWTLRCVTPLAERQEALAAQGVPALGGHRVEEDLQADWAVKRSRVPALRGLLLLREDLQFGAQPRADKPGRRAAGIGRLRRSDRLLETGCRDGRAMR